MWSTKAPATCHSRSHLAAISGAEFFTVEVLRGCISRPFQDEEEHDRDPTYFCCKRKVLIFAKVSIIL